MVYFLWFGQETKKAPKDLFVSRCRWLFFLDMKEVTLLRVCSPAASFPNSIPFQKTFR